MDENSIEAQLESHYGALLLLEILLLNESSPKEGAHVVSKCEAFLKKEMEKLSNEFYGEAKRLLRKICVQE